MPERKPQKRASAGSVAPSTVGRKPRNEPDPPVVIDLDDGVFKWASKLSVRELMDMFPGKSKGK